MKMARGRRQPVPQIQPVSQDTVASESAAAVVVPDPSQIAEIEARIAKIKAELSLLLNGTLACVDRNVEGGDLFFAAITLERAPKALNQLIVEIYDLIDRLEKARRR